MKHNLPMLRQNIMYKVNEIFHSVQGEGSFSGCPATFIRLSGCNLSCSWCDTDFSQKYDLTAKEIADMIKYEKAVITGGEPTIYDLEPLLFEIKKRGKVTMLETNGTNPTDNIRHLFDWIVCSPKPQNNWAINPKCLFDELKYVVDGKFNPKLHIPEEIKENYKNRIWLQPESSKYKIRSKEAYEFAMNDFRLRVGIQLHKIIDVR